MTKLMMCEDCGDIVAPSRRDFNPRWCDCGRHAVWWEDGRAGKLVLLDKIDGKAVPGSHYDGFPSGGPRAWVIGIHNAVLVSQRGLTAEDVKQVIEAAEGYLFKTRGSLIIRLRPLESNDTRWSPTLPGDPASQGDASANRH